MATKRVVIILDATNDNPRYLAPNGATWVSLLLMAGQFTKEDANKRIASLKPLFGVKALTTGRVGCSR